MSLYLSRIRLARAPDTAALAHLLMPPEDNARIAAAHRLIWSLFADAPDRSRDFLWREDGGAGWQRTTFLVLSARPPEDLRGLFEIDEPKVFAPALSPGQRLRFRLRASPGASEMRPHGQRGKRIDPLARALRDLPREARGGERDAVTQAVGAHWLRRQGAGAGFRLAEEAEGEGGSRPLLRVDGDAWRVLPRDGGRPVRFSSLDFEGELVVEDPAAFLAALARGFGRAKAFGCGLMLIRRP
ncbi:type I-E CRISPR-associated protein Cas6/Cse3/CasE [Methylobacterium oryzihabitans]|uniref:Type I-E CRISPR-associated protein Cas6/Cse3/CasE n=1 Tax=Methylobacterium oryzihabitans TaxID=2499852 RepID=A0A3S2VJ79_9HYPH|nr:type I-E CRISPR-associated protein Cas6/Cse3/CasE [Methylobacterium oryzihabitans]RVU14165.1 type I-E CRISPR-associated protein Cas6/Cse3/CasE [Methylobacterium oryzihabitans]